ncbi:MAG: CerR family C-terminal domain-containing protein [Syntrophobacteraceae bacterium]
MPEGSTKHKADTKKRLLEAAGEVFAEHGYRASTVRQICQRAHTHIGSVNYHFRDKKGLYAAIFSQSFELAVAKYPPDLGLTGQTSPEEKLRAYIHSLLLRLMGEGLPAWHGKLLASEMAEPSGALDEVVERSIRPLYTYLADIVRELTKEKKPVDGEESERTFLTSLSIVGQCLHHHIARHLIEALRPAAFDPAHIERITDHITRFSLGGIRELAAGGVSRVSG